MTGGLLFQNLTHLMNTGTYFTTISSCSVHFSQIHHKNIFVERFINVEYRSINHDVCVTLAL